MDAFEIKPNVSSRYRHFDRWYRAELALFLFFGPALVVLWVVSAWYFYYTGRLPLPIVKLAVYFTTTFIFARIFYRNFSAAAEFKSVVVDTEKIVKRSAGGISAIDCAEIKRVRRLKIPFVNRWIVLEASGPKKRFTLPIYVRNGHRMVERVFGDLEVRGVRFDGAAALREKLYNAARRYNILHKLRAKQMPRLFRAATAAALFGWVTAAIYWERGMLMVLSMGFLNMFLQVGAYFIAEKFHLKKLLRRGGKIKIDADSEITAGYYVIAGLSALLIGMTIGIFITEPA